MSVIKKLSYHDDLLAEKEKILLSNGKTWQKIPSLTPALSDTELEHWKKLKSTELEILRDWLKKQPHLPQAMSDQDILTFLHSCYYSIEKTKLKIDSYYTIRTHASEMFTNRVITSKELLRAQKITRISPLRSASPEGYNVIFVDSLDPDAANFNFVDAMKIASVSIDVLVRCFPKEEGNILVLDMQRSALAHIVKTNLSMLRTAMIYVQKALPFRLKQVHVINAFSLIQQIQMMVKPFIDDGLSKMIHIHMQDNMETFYKFIPKQSLPKDYGGEAESLQELNDKLNQMIRAHEPYLKDLEHLLVDENKRTGSPKGTNDIFGMEGSFRRLELD